MTTFETSLSIKTNYLQFPRDGEILGPSNFSSFLPLSSLEVQEQKNIEKLEQLEQQLQLQLKEARMQQNIMVELFQSLLQIENGGKTAKSKIQRRCAKDLVVKYHCPHHNCNKFYSANSALQRHVRSKHITKNEPPQPYYQLHPEPNLIFESDSSNSEALNRLVDSSGIGLKNYL